MMAPEYPGARLPLHHALTTRSRRSKRALEERREVWIEAHKRGWDDAMQAMQTRPTPPGGTS